MRLSHWTLFFAVIALCLFIPLNYRTQMVAAEQKENQTDERDLLTACESGLAVVDLTDEEVYGSRAIREKAIEAFYDTYCKNSSISKENAIYKIPCCLLMDWDGYYICYTSPSTSKNADGTVYYDDAYSEKFTWSKSYGTVGDYSYTIEYHLDNTIALTKVTASKSFCYEGKYSEVLEDLTADRVLLSAEADLQVKNILKDDEAFTNEKYEVITEITNDKVNYFLNTHNTYFNSNEQGYSFSMPGADVDSSSTYQARKLQAPAFVAFVQGVQKKTGKEIINSYAFTGTDITSASLYYINYMQGQDGVWQYIYHEDESCKYLQDQAAVRIDTMENCAKAGASPCRCVGAH